MKKVFTLLTLLLTAVTGAWAQTTLFEYSMSEKKFTTGAESVTTNNVTIGSSAVKIHSNSDAVYGISFGSSFKVEGEVPSNYLLLSPTGGFKKGDVITIAGVFNNSDESKLSKIGIWGGDDIYTQLFLTEQFINGRTNAGDPVEETFLLTADVPSLYFGRYGSTGTHVLVLNVVRPAAGPVDPVFSLTENEIVVGETSQVQVGSKGNLDGITLTGLTSSDPAVATVNATTGLITAISAGTTTISFTASSAVADKYNATSATVNLPLTVTAPILTTDLIDYPTAETGITVGGTCVFSTVKINENKNTVSGIKFANGYTTESALNENYVTLEIEGGFKVGDIVTIAGAFNNSDDGKQSKVDIFTGEGSSIDVLFTTMQFVNGRTSADSPVEETYTLESDYDKLYLGRNGGTATFITTLKVSRPPLGVTIPSSGVGTFACAQALDFTSADVEAYVVSAVSASAATLEKVTAVPANTGIILKGAAGAHSIPVAVSADAPATNLLKAAVTATAVGANEAYVLKDGLFHLVNTASTVPAGKAYLLASDVTSPELSLDFDGTGEISTGIENVEAQKGFLDGEFYNLNGQRVAQPTKGLYIVNGRKVIIK